MSITRLNPETLYHSPVFTQVATVEPPARLIFIGGQNGVNAQGELVGDDVASQSEQAYRNVIAALAAAGATLNNVVKMTIYLVQGQSFQEAYAATLRVPVERAEPPTISGMLVVGLANPRYLVEIEAVAAVPVERP